MSLDIETYVGKLPKNPRDLWQETFKATGLTCEFRPDFEPESWTAGDLIGKIEVSPSAFPGGERYGKNPFIAGCHLEIQSWPEPSKEWLARFPRAMQAQLKQEATSVFKERLEQCAPPLRATLKKTKSCFLFQTRFSCPPPDWRFLITAAATLAKVTGGLLYIPSQGAFYAGDDAIGLARNESKLAEEQQAIRLKAGQGWKVRNFRSWKIALKGTEPESSEE
jgi:hypothetical protein